MTSLADELFAATSNKEPESTDVSTHSIQRKDLENDPNLTNTSLVKPNMPGKCLPSYLHDVNTCEAKKEQYLYPADTSDDMDITCDVTLPAMSRRQLDDNLGVVSSNITQAQDIAMDETIAINTRQQALLDNKRDYELPDLNIRNMKVSEKLFSDSKLVNSSTCEQMLLEGETGPKQEIAKQTSCLWSRISTDFDQDEETANFGTRYAIETDGKLFDVFTYATIEPKVNKLFSLI